MTETGIYMVRISLSITENPLLSLHTHTYTHKSRVKGGGVAGLKAGMFIIVFYPCGPSYWFEDWSVALPKPMKCIPNIWYLSAGKEMVFLTVRIISYQSIQSWTCLHPSFMVTWNKLTTE